ncbi:MAG: hypothetical protein A2136_02815 [Chloroflexi bacterium RBG_16_54_11]|nr:MAG: hypothetical protein A2136_02815 [Chloroflexi bacterium RBG_16_54_11]
MPQLEKSAVIDALQHGQVTIKGEFMWGSNYTFLAEVICGEAPFLSVYKPSRGERPLWDFPAESLARREAAAYHVSEALGWELVPPTVYRQEAPIGPGSLQLFIEHNPEVHYFNLSKADRQSLRPVVMFDLLVNNADRKGSHLLFDKNHHLWLIDHGICFHAEDKLRTVIWDFVGQSIPANLLNDLGKFCQALIHGSSLDNELRKLLNREEVDALSARAEHLVSVMRFPEPEPDERSFPWPLL